MNDKDFIFSVVSAFYEKAKIDVLIGYHFRHITDFDSHIPRIAAFWEIQLLGKTERLIDVPFDMIGVHRPLSIKKGELGRWLVLFKQTLEEKMIGNQHFEDLKKEWLSRLEFFEKTFLRFLGL